MHTYYNNSINITNTTSNITYTNFHPSYWEYILIYLLFAYVISCAMTVNLKRCDAETYGENIICCCCMCYRDLVSSLFMIVLYILLAFIEYAQCNCISKKRIKNTRLYFRDKYRECKFTIGNRINPMQATIVENTNINTSIVIEGLNNNHKVISVLIVPINEIIV